MGEKGSGFLRLCFCGFASEVQELPKFQNPVTFGVSIGAQHKTLRRKNIVYRLGFLVLDNPGSHYRTALQKVPNLNTQVNINIFIYAKLILYIIVLSLILKY